MKKHEYRFTFRIPGRPSVQGEVHAVDGADAWQRALALLTASEQDQLGDGNATLIVEKVQLPPGF